MSLVLRVLRSVFSTEKVLPRRDVFLYLVFIFLQNMANLRQTPLTCSGHTRPVVYLDFSAVTDSGYYLISACKGKKD